MTSTLGAAQPKPHGTPDASNILVRPLRRHEESALVDVFDAMSARSRELRFLTSKSGLRASELKHLMNIDHHDREALVAWSPWSTTEGGRRAIGIARFARSVEDASAADVAVSGSRPLAGPRVGTRTGGRPRSEGAGGGYPPIRCADVLRERRRSKAAAPNCCDSPTR